MQHRLRHGQVPEPRRPRRLRWRQHRDTEQWTVRCSRRFAPDVGATGGGPSLPDRWSHWSARRFSLAPNDVVPISFESTFAGACAMPAMEEPERAPQPQTVSVSTPTSSALPPDRRGPGWADVDGTSTDLDDARGSGPAITRGACATWWARRWRTSSRPPCRPSTVRPRSCGSPVTLRRPDGRSATASAPTTSGTTGGAGRPSSSRGGIELSDGRRKPFTAWSRTAAFRDDNRRLLGADHRRGDGRRTRSHRSASPPVADTGFHLGAGLYFGSTATTTASGAATSTSTASESPTAPHRGRPPPPPDPRHLVRVADPVGGGVGYGNLQSIFAGPHPEIGLTEEASFL